MIFVISLRFHFKPNNSNKGLYNHFNHVSENEELLSLFSVSPNNLLKFVIKHLLSFKCQCNGVNIIIST